MFFFQPLSLKVKISMKQNAPTVQLCQTAKFALLLVLRRWRLGLISKSFRKSWSKINSQRCNCTSGSARTKRDLIFVIHPQTSAKCRCIIDSSKVVDFDFCPKDEDILGPGDEGYDDPIFQPIIPTRFNEFNGESFTEEDLEKENFKCQSKQQFKVACNTCWCNSKGDGAKSCTRIACNPRTYLTL